MTKTSSPTQVHAVLFDLDGTLLDTVALILASMRYSTRTVLGVEISDRDLMHGVGTPLDDQMRVFSPERMDELVRVYREHNDQVHDELIREYPGVERFLDRLLERGVPMGVVTSKRRCVALQGMTLFGMEKYFATIICADDVERHKPDPLPLIRAAEAIGVPVEATAYVGDTPYDIAAAKTAGAVPVGVTWGVFPRDELAACHPEYLVDSVDELARLSEDLVMIGGPAW